MSVIHIAELFDKGKRALAERRFADAVDAFEECVKQDPRHVDAIVALGYARTARSDEFFARISDPQTDGASLRAFADALSDRLPRPARRVLRPSPRRPGRLRIGFLSPDFNHHSCAFFMRSLFANRDRAQFEFHCYADFQETPRDAMSGWFERSADVWTETTKLNMPQLAERIRDAAIDVLVDVGGYSVGSTVSVCAYRPARKIVSWLGFPASTGIREIGYRIADPVSDPPGPADAHFGEKLIRLDGPFLCFSPDDGVPIPASVPEGDICFGTFNAQHKLNFETAKLWARIVNAVPRARLLLKCRLGNAIAGQGANVGAPALESKIDTREYLTTMFAAAGLPPDRLILLDFARGMNAHLETYSKLHIALDPFPYNGTTTTCEALWMGVPVLALRGNRHSANVGASILQHAGFGELVAENPDDYVSKAVALAADRDRLAAYRADLRSRMSASPIANAAAWTRLFEDALRWIHSDRPDGRRTDSA